MPRIRSRPYSVTSRICHLILACALLFAAPASAAERLILAFGDSLTAGYQLRASESFPAQLEAALRNEGQKVRVHNAGVSGDTTAAGKARLSWVLNSLKQKPDLVILALGANDMLRGQPVANTRANLNAMLSELARRDIPVILAGMLAAPNLGADYARQYNAVFPELARKHKARLYPFFLNEVITNRSLLLKDGMHPNAAGVKVMVRNILPTVRQELD